MESPAADVFFAEGIRPRRPRRAPNISPGGSRKISRYLWCVIAVAATLGPALVGPSSAEDPKVRERKATTAPVQVLLGPKLAVTQVQFYQGGNPPKGTNNPKNYLTVPEVTPGKFKVKVTITNAGMTKSFATKVTLEMKGGKKVGTYDWSYYKTFVKNLPSIAPNQGSMSFFFDLEATDPGPYWFTASLP